MDKCFLNLTVFSSFDEDFWNQEEFPRFFFRIRNFNMTDRTNMSLIEAMLNNPHAFKFIVSLTLDIPEREEESLHFLQNIQFLYTLQYLDI